MTIKPLSTYTVAIEAQAKDHVFIEYLPNGFDDEAPAPVTIRCLYRGNPKGWQADVRVRPAPITKRTSYTTAYGNLLDAITDAERLAHTKSKLVETCESAVAALKEVAA